MKQGILLTADYKYGHELLEVLIDKTNEDVVSRVSALEEELSFLPPNPINEDIDKWEEHDWQMYARLNPVIFEQYMAWRELKEKVDMFNGVVIQTIPCY